MKLYECQAKTIFKQFGIPIPKGRIASNARSAKRISEELGGKVVIKAQILTGGRGKAGGIQPVQTPEEAYVVTSKILSMKIHGLPVKKILVEEIVDFSREMYLGLFVDRTEKQHVILSSKTGGINIENRIMDDPKSLHYFPIDLLLGLQEYKIREIAISLDIPKELWMPFSTICSGLYNAYKKNDAILAEINPLVLTTDNHLKALDGKMTIDDNALFRQPQFVDCCDMGTQSEFEQQANKTGLSFFSLHGNIGCMVNGAGLALATMDMIQQFGGMPSNFMDLGGGAGVEKVKAGLQSILTNPRVRSVLINIFGGITRCDTVARGLADAIDDIRPNIPIVARLVGTNMLEAKNILINKHLIWADTLVDAVQNAIDAANG